MDEQAHLESTPAALEPLKDVPTWELVRELQSREGVKAVMLKPYESYSSTVEGPAIVLTVID